MSVADLPPGEWTPLLIGDQWPSGISLSLTSTGATKRKTLSSEFTEYFDRLLGIQNQNLAPQQGITADDLRAAFKQGTELSDHIAYANGVKSSAYTSVNDKLVQLRSDLTTLAEEGNSEINTINKSKRPLIDKIAEIVKVITRTRAAAFSQAAACVGHISDEIRKVLGAQGIDTTPQAFASQHGVETMQRTSGNKTELERQIKNRLEATDGPAEQKVSDQIGQSAGTGPASAGTTPESSATTTSPSTDTAPTAAPPTATAAAPAAPSPAPAPRLVDAGGDEGGGEGAHRGGPGAAGGVGWVGRRCVGEEAAGRTTHPSTRCRGAPHRPSRPAHASHTAAGVGTHTPRPPPALPPPS